MFQDRKASYKVPPSAIIDPHFSQQARRAKALEEQKRRRAQRVDATRQLDLFADLNLDDEGDEDEIEETVVREGVGRFVSMLPDSFASTSVAASAAISPPDQTIPRAHIQGKKKGKKRKGKPKGQTSRKPNKWADKCMYAELLEMKEDDPWTDGLPHDLETGWVAVAPVPVGKRCLAVTHHAAGLAGIAPNTTLRSRVLGKSLLPPFPSCLPPDTILDCILDPNWRYNGILHVLDVVKWKSQDLGDCETAFRFWWRDTRLSELTPLPPPPTADPSSESPFQPFPSLPGHAQNSGSTYRFPYPTSFAPIPYHLDTSILSLSSTIISLARSSRFISIDIPAPFSFPLSSSNSSEEPSMDVDHASSHSSLLTGKGELASISCEVKPDGLLLYVAQASFEPGISPLSNWIPIIGYHDEESHPGPGVPGHAHKQPERPLDTFERLVGRRLSGVVGDAGTPEVDMTET
ncbi:hypothetical protein JAAARDRAFT_191717 [Jaapia argillacea MUCL 33604]|uniref:Snurportin-1 n=1 Tax=Jaapia argillacea MUCL 33604 TaxID=933084 RepID=A0A067Q2F5_9AGAM|nr:hypothetical protein JAAARDRAFT_191717 [Jaapia argillacea MUCL 33604]